jgi:hypothetical protein
LLLGTTSSTSYVSSWETLGAINDDYQPSDSQDKGPGAYGNWPETGVQWVQYDFDQSFTIDRVAAYWWDDNLGIDLPSASNVQYWNGSSFVDVPNGAGFGVADHQYNETTFDPVTTEAIRLEFTSNGDNSTGILEFQVWTTGGVVPTSIPTDVPTDVPTGVPTDVPTDTPTPTPEPTVPPTTDLVVWYTFDESSGTTAADSSGNGLDATLVNGPTWVAGQSGNAVSLDGSNDYVSLPIGVISELDDFTLATWVRLDTSGSWRRVFDFGTGTSVNMFLVPQSGSNTVRFAITTGGWSSEEQINGTASLSTGTWTHVAVTKSGSTGILYVNGVEVGTNSSMTLSPSDLGNTGNNWLGRSQYSGDAYLDGRIDDFRIYSRALSASEVSDLTAE